MILLLLLGVSVLALGVTAQSRLRMKHELSCKEVEIGLLESKARYYEEQVVRLVKPVDGPFRGFLLLPPSPPLEEEGKTEEIPTLDPPAQLACAPDPETLKSVEEWQVAYRSYEKASDRYIKHVLDYPRNKDLQEEILAEMEVLGVRLTILERRLETRGVDLDDVILSTPPLIVE